MIEVRIQRAPRDGFSVDLEFRTSAGITVLFGPAGAGKSFVLDAIAGFAKPDKGRVLLDSRAVFDSDSGLIVPARSRRCGYLPSVEALLPHMTLRHNLLFSAACGRLPRIERHRKASEILDRFGLADAALRRSGEVSASERLRGAVARVLVGGPKVLLVDDLAGGLDVELQAEAGRLLRRVRDEFETPVLLATRDLDFCLDVADDVLVLGGGRLLQQGSPKELFEQPAGIEAARILGFQNLLPAEIKLLDPARNISRLRIEQAELTGPYFPGRFRGDRVTVCMRPEELAARPAAGKPGPNQLPVQVVRAVERPTAVRIEFSGGILVDVPRPDYESSKHLREWLVEIPEARLRVV